MNQSSTLPASTRDRHTSFRRLLLLLISLLAFGLFVSLPSSGAADARGLESDRADRVLATEPFIVVGNDLARAVRSIFNGQIDDDSSDSSAAPGLANDIFQTVISVTSLVKSITLSLHPLPVSSLPGAPRAPPVSPL